MRRDSAQPGILDTLLLVRERQFLLEAVDVGPEPDSFASAGSRRAAGVEDGILGQRDDVEHTRANLLAPGLWKCDFGWIVCRHRNLRGLVSIVYGDHDNIRRSPELPWSRGRAKIGGPLYPSGWLLVLCPENQPHLGRLPAVRMILGLSTIAEDSWRFPGRALVIAETEFVRGVIVNTLRSIGCLCHSAKTFEDGLALLRRDCGVDVIINGSGSSSAITNEFITSARQIRPHVNVVHLSERQGGQETGEAGLRMSSRDSSNLAAVVADLLDGRLGNCHECGLPVLLEPIQPGQDAIADPICHCGPRVDLE